METKHWITDIDRITSMFNNEFGGLSAEDLNWKPTPNTWSVAQNIDHLIVINETYYPVIRKVRDNNYKLPWIARFDFMVKFFGKFILNSVQPDRKRKMKTFPIWEPSKSLIGGDILKRFEKNQGDLKKLIMDSQDLLDKGTVISSPANRNIVYKLDAAFDIIIAHEKRHFEQAKEVLENRLTMTPS